MISRNERRIDAEKLKNVLDYRLVTVVSAQTECKDTEEIENITPEQFIKDLNSYVNSGIFSDSLDFVVKQTGEEFMQIKVDYKSSCLIYCITCTLRLCEGVTMEAAYKELTKTIFDIIAEKNISATEN